MRNHCRIAGCNRMSYVLLEAPAQLAQFAAVTKADDVNDEADERR